MKTHQHDMVRLSVSFSDITQDSFSESPLLVEPALNKPIIHFMPAAADDTIKYATVTEAATQPEQHNTMEHTAASIINPINKSSTRNNTVPIMLHIVNNRNTNIGNSDSRTKVA